MECGDSSPLSAKASDNKSRTAQVVCSGLCYWCCRIAAA